MRWIGPLQLAGGLAFFLAGFAFLGGQYWAAAVFGVIVIAGMAAVSELRCPRCGSHFRRGSTNRLLRREPIKPREVCFDCGRSRRDVYPFQRMIAPEPRSWQEDD